MNTRAQLNRLIREAATKDFTAEQWRDRVTKWRDLLVQQGVNEDYQAFLKSLVDMIKPTKGVS